MQDLLQDALSSDHAKRTGAESIIISLQNNDFLTFLDVLIKIFCEEADTLSSYRITAGILLRNSLHSADQATQYQIEAKWMDLENGFRQRVKELLLANMHSQKPKVALISGSILAAIARIEVVRESFKDFFVVMHSYLEKDNDATVGAALEGVGSAATYLIEETGYSFSSDSDVIFSVILKKLTKGESTSIKMGALKCLINSLEALESTMSNSQNVALLLGAMVSIACEDEDLMSYMVECLYMILGLYYRKLGQSFDVLLDFVKRVSKTESERVSIQAIEFWCILAEIEVDIGGCLVEKNLFQIMDYLLSKLFKHEEQDEGGWNSHKAAANCIEYVAKCVKTELLEFDLFRNFVVENINSGDTHRQEAGTIALGCGISGKVGDRTGTLSEVVPLVVGNIKNEHLKESSLWTLSKLCEANFDTVDPGAVLPVLVQNTIQVIQENSRNSVYAAYLVSSFSSCLADTRDKVWDYENQVSFFYYDILDVMIKATEVVDFKDVKLRRALFTALTDLVTAASENVSVVLNEMLKYIVNKSIEYLKYQNNTEQFLVLEDIISSYIVIVQNIILVRKEDRIGEMKEQVLFLFLEVLKAKASCIHGDVYITLSVLCTPTSYFTMNISSFLPSLVQDLKTSDFYVLKAAINLVGDIANSLNQGFLVYSERLVPGLMQCLVSASTQRELKPVLLSVFGDVALSLGASFKPYLDMTMHILGQIMGLQRKFNEDFVDTLRKDAVQMIDCVVIALGHEEKVRANLGNIVMFIQKIVGEDEEKRCMKDCVSLIGDLIKGFGKIDGLDKDWVHKYLEACAGEDDPDISNVAQKSLLLWVSSN